MALVTDHGPDVAAGTFWSRNPEVVFRPLAEDGEAVVLHLGTGAYHGVNRTGCLIWSLLERPRSEAHLADELGRLVDDPPDDLGAIVTTFLKSLHERDLVSAGPAG